MEKIRFPLVSKNLTHLIGNVYNISEECHECKGKELQVEGQDTPWP